MKRAKSEILKQAQKKKRRAGKLMIKKMDLIKMLIDDGSVLSAIDLMEKTVIDARKVYPIFLPAKLFNDANN